MPTFQISALQDDFFITFTEGIYGLRATVDYIWLENTIINMLLKPFVQLLNFFTKKKSNIFLSESEYTH